MAAFYRVQDEQLQEAPNFVYAPTYTLSKEEKDTYAYPTEGGWYWFDTIEEAATFFGVPVPPDPTELQDQTDPSSPNYDPTITPEIFDPLNPSA